MTMFASLFRPRPEPRPTPHERRALMFALLESGSVHEYDLPALFRWAAQRQNAEMLDLIVAGDVTVARPGATLEFRAREGKVPGWAMAEGRELE